MGVKVPSTAMAKALREAQVEADEAATALANQKDTASAMKFAAFRFGMKVYTEQRLYYMAKLRDRAGASSAEASARPPTSSADEVAALPAAELQVSDAAGSGQ